MMNRMSLKSKKYQLPSPRVIAVGKLTVVEAAPDWR